MCKSGEKPLQSTDLPTLNSRDLYGRCEETLPAPFPFQQIVAQGITPSLLEWKGIEATENLAKSPNSKVVVIGNNKNGLPLILGQ